MSEIWRLVHLAAAAYWLGGLISLAVVAVVAHRALRLEDFRTLMRAAGRAFAWGSIAGWALLGVSGAAMAAPRLGGDLGKLPRTAWGRFLETKTSLAVLAVALTAVHAYAGSRVDSKGWVLASRLISGLLFLVSLAIFWLAVRMTEG